MSIDDLTIGEAKRLVELLRPLLGEATTPATPESPFEPYIGHHVVVRDHRAGVYMGRVARVGPTSIALAAGTRQAWYWEGAGACMGLARTGPLGGKITAPSSGAVAMLDVVGVYPCSQEAIAQWAKLPTWDGRNG